MIWYFASMESEYIFKIFVSVAGQNIKYDHRDYIDYQRNKKGFFT